MTLGKVVGTVVATRKDEKLIGSKLLIVEEVDLDGNPLNRYTVAVDSVGAGIGEIVLTASGSSARQTNVTRDKPVDGVIMAIVDFIEVHGEIRYQK
jgi:microcompartment protein CcmK/EutM